VKKLKKKDYRITNAGRKRVSTSLKVEILEKAFRLAMSLSAERMERVGINKILEEGIELMIKKYKSEEQNKLAEDERLGNPHTKIGTKSAE